MLGNSKYVEGDIYPDSLPESPQQGMFFPYQGGWNYPMRVPKDDGKLVRFGIPKKLRELGETPEPMRVAMLPSVHVPEEPEFEGESVGDMPQLPVTWPKFAGFGAVTGDSKIPLIMLGVAALVLYFGFKGKGGG